MNVYHYSPEVAKRIQSIAIAKALGLSGFIIVCVVVISLWKREAAEIYRLLPILIVLYIVVLIIARHLIKKKLGDVASLAIRVDAETFSVSNGEKLVARVSRSEATSIEETDKGLSIKTASPYKVAGVMRIIGESDYNEIRQTLSLWMPITRAGHKRWIGTLTSVSLTLAVLTTLFLSKNLWIVLLSGTIAIFYMGNSYRKLRKGEETIVIAQQQKMTLYMLIVVAMITLFKIYSILQMK